MERARANSADRSFRRDHARDRRQAVAASDPRRRGVVLLDIVLTLAVMLLSVRIVWPLLPFDTSPARQTAYAHEIAALLDTDRITAARVGRVVTTRIDVRRKQLVGGASGWSLTLPRDVVLDVVTTADCTVDPDRFAIGFAPDGRSCGLALTLIKAKRPVRVNVNWLTGFVEVSGGGRG